MSVPTDGPTVAAVILIALAGSAMAYPRVLPPAEYDHPYKGHLRVTRVASEAEVREMCPGVTFTLGALACTHRTSLGCFVTMVSDAIIREHGTTPQTVLRHEIAHCNGWPGDHRGAR